MKRFTLFALCVISAVAASTVSRSAHAQVTETTLAKRQATGLWGRFKASNVALGTYLGSGSFVASEYSDNPYFAQDLTLYPRFKLADGLSVRALWTLGWEYTQPDSNTKNLLGRHVSFTDLRLSLNHTKLYVDPFLKGTFGASFSAYLPTSKESRYNNTIMNLRLGGNYTVHFFNDKLELLYGFAIQKYIPSAKYRGFGPTSSPVQGDDGYSLVLPTRRGGDQDLAAGSGGRLNDNWAFINSFHVGYTFTPKWSASIDLAIFNYMRYAVNGAFSDPNLPQTGWGDTTRGTIEVAYQALDYLTLSLGIDSNQPARTEDGKSIRFPFYDFKSPANNFTQWYLNATVVY